VRGDTSDRLAAEAWARTSFGLRGLGVPHHDLDAVVFVDERWTLRPIPDRDELVARILASPGFVTEGGFLGWRDGFFAAADHIVWLEPPFES
jgi:hypothetical protein